MIKVMLDGVYDIFISNLVKKWLIKTLGKDCKVKIKELEATTDNGNTKIHVELDASIKQEDMFAILSEKMGL